MPAERPELIPGRLWGTSPPTVALFALLFVIALLPVLTMPIPAMVDYPNHLARMYILVRDGTPQAHPFYRVTWALYPNLAMDLVVPLVARITSVELATRLFLLASQILTITGAIAIELAVKRRFQVSGFLALLVLYSVPFAWGFVNFQFALGIALWGIACWIVLQDRAWPLRLALHTLFVTLLFGAHLFALGLYGFTLGIHELWRARTRKPALPTTMARFLTLALPALVAFGVMKATGGAVGQEGTAWNGQTKLLMVFATLNGYDLWLSTGGTVILVGLIGSAAMRGAVRPIQSGCWLAAGLAALFVVLPTRLFDTSFVDLRVTVAALLIVPGFIVVSPPSRAWGRLAAVAVLGVTLVNLASALTVAAIYRGEYAALVASFGQLKPGSRVLVGHSGSGEDAPLGDLSDYPIYNAATLAVAYADAFVPTLFTSIGKQPVTVIDGYRRLAVPYGGPTAMVILRDIAEGRPNADAPGYTRTWTEDFDYLYVVGPSAPNPMPGLLVPLAASARFALYRIERRRPGE
ncbi:MULTISPECIES: hypothetical protein [Methylobacterium]|uniref:Glycosyltransferase RgtA/B/C/D-like domain-containing protein n=1 Tax=Methylobacterium bullatum TaxID=570505 RepID=A0A679K179_9HYPH|nr:MULTISPECIES: hypothetical protein [Methylobacterium]GJD39029.1 hypothetical protein OICFNHDK_1481 [Methylobacterium bullatum]CAA2138023.1 hypothetical protein MBLL_00939 [Methylobacterium bullatum]